MANSAQQDTWQAAWQEAHLRHVDLVSAINARLYDLGIDLMQWEGGYLDSTNPTPEEKRATIERLRFAMEQLNGVLEEARRKQQLRAGRTAGA